MKKYETVVSSGQSALRALLTMNGGAIVVFLSFLGHVLDNGTKGTIQPESMRIFAAALSWFIGAVFCALLAYGAIFVTNCFSSIEWGLSSNIAFGVTLAGGLGSLGCFVAGSLRAVDAFQSVATLL